MFDFMQRQILGMQWLRELIGDLPAVDVVVTMGCNVQCPWLPCSHREDRGMDDSTGKSDEIFRETICRIEEKILDLMARLKP